MKTRVQKWGNSLAVRIPKSVAADAQLNENTPVELSLARGRLIIQALVPERPKLADLLRGITKSNLHKEWTTGSAVGKEIW